MPCCTGIVNEEVLHVTSIIILIKIHLFSALLCFIAPFVSDAHSLGSVTTHEFILKIPPVLRLANPPTGKARVSDQRIFGALRVEDGTQQLRSIPSLVCGIGAHLLTDWFSLQVMRASFEDLVSMVLLDVSGIATESHIRFSPAAADILSCRLFFLLLVVVARVEGAVAINAILIRLGWNLCLFLAPIVEGVALMS